MTAAEAETRELGWNGIKLVIPARCEDIVSGDSHLVVEYNFQPLIEVRWESTTKKRSSDALIKEIKKSTTAPFTLLAPLKQLASQARENEGIFLKWDEQNSSQVYIYQCRATLQVVFCQYYKHPDFSLTDIAEIITSISFAGDTDEHLIWAVQDFRVKLPRTMRLESSHFTAGLTQLVFVENKTLFRLCRLAPATDKLRGTDLLGVLTTLHDEFSHPLCSSSTGENNANCWLTPPLTKQILLRLKRKKSFCRGRIIHDELHNRLLAVTAESNHPVTEESIQAIFESYEIIPRQQ